MLPISCKYMFDESKLMQVTQSTRSNRICLFTYVFDCTASRNVMDNPIIFVWSLWFSHETQKRGSLDSRIAPLRLATTKFEEFSENRHSYFSVRSSLQGSFWANAVQQQADVPRRQRTSGNHHYTRRAASNASSSRMTRHFRKIHIKCIVESSHHRTQKV